MIMIVTMRTTTAPATTWQTWTWWLTFTDDDTVSTFEWINQTTAFQVNGNQVKGNLDFYSTGSCLLLYLFLNFECVMFSLLESFCCLSVHILSGRPVACRMSRVNSACNDHGSRTPWAMGGSCRKWRYYYQYCSRTVVCLVLIETWTVNHEHCIVLQCHAVLTTWQLVVSSVNIKQISSKNPTISIKPSSVRSNLPYSTIAWQRERIYR
jgi:hypothetical protein